MAPAWLSVPRAPSSLLRHDHRHPAARRRVTRAAFRRPGTAAAAVVHAAAQRTRLPVAVAAATKMGAAASGDERLRTFVEEMRAVAMRLHTRDQSRHGEKEVPLEPAVAMWEPTLQGFLRFLVDSKLVFQTLEAIVDRAAVPWYAEFRNTGLERSEALEKDLEWLKQQGHTIPEASDVGITYAAFLQELSEKEPQAFITHFYNLYFGHAAGGVLIGKKVTEKINIQKELEFYKWEGT